MLERLMFERNVHDTPVDNLPSGVLSSTYYDILSLGRVVTIQAIETDKVGNQGLFTVYELGSKPDGMAVTEDEKIVTGLPTKYIETVAGPAVFPNARAALKAGEKATRQRHLQERRAARSNPLF